MNQKTPEQFYGWCTDGQGNSWGHFPKEPLASILPVWVFFLVGFACGGLGTFIVWSLL